MLHRGRNRRGPGLANLVQIDGAQPLDLDLVGGDDLAHSVDRHVVVMAELDETAIAGGGQ